MAAAAAPAPQLGGRAAWTALILVVLVQALSLLDRQVLAILVPRIRADLGVGDAEMGLLYGTVFALFYAIFSLPLGRLADGWIPGGGIANVDPEPLTNPAAEGIDPEAVERAQRTINDLRARSPLHRDDLRR